MKSINNEAEYWISNNPNTYRTLLSNINKVSDSFLGIPFIDSEGNIINKKYEKELQCIIKEYANEFRTVIEPLNSFQTAIMRKGLSNDEGFPLKTRAIALQYGKSADEIAKIDELIYKKLFVRLFFTCYLVKNLDSLVLAYYQKYVILDDIKNMPIKFIFNTDSTFKVKDLICLPSSKVHAFLGEENFITFREFIHDLAIAFPDENITYVRRHLIDKIDRKMAACVSEVRALGTMRAEILDEKFELTTEVYEEYEEKHNELLKKGSHI